MRLKIETGGGGNCRSVAFAPPLAHQPFQSNCISTFNILNSASISAVYTTIKIIVRNISSGDLGNGYAAQPSETDKLLMNHENE